jgi:hypothetical protein
MIEMLAGLNTKRTLFLGDTLVLVLVTIYGFATHGEIGNFIRMLTTFIPLTFSWFILAPFFGLYDENLASQISQLWRVILAMIAVVPLAAWLRGLWLQTPILPIFVLVLGVVCIIAMLLWRSLYLGINKYSRQSHG